MKKDGDFTVPFQHGAIIPIVDGVTQSTGFLISYRQYAKNFKRLAYGSTGGPAGTTLVEESAPRGTGIGGVIEWDRTYWPLPPERDEYEQFVYGYQALVSDELAEVPLFVRSRVHFQYFVIPSQAYPSPSFVQESQVYRIFKLGDGYYVTGTYPGTNSEIIGENSVTTRWKGSIYQQKTRYVPAFTKTLLV